MDFEKNVISILTNVLGDPKRDYTSSGGWIEFNCPCCADEIGHPVLAAMEPVNLQP